MLKIPIVFVSPEVTFGSYTGALGGPPLIEDWFEKEKSKLIFKLRSSFPNVEFIFYNVRNVDEAKKVLDIEKDCIGFVVVVLHTWSRGATRVFLESGKPVILVAESYGGGGEFLIEFGKALREGRRVVGISTRSIDSDDVVKKVKLLEVLHKLKNTRILFITIDKQRFDHYENMLRSLFGVESIYIDGKDFAEKYYLPVGIEEASEWARKWVSNAYRVYEDRYEEVVKAAKLYIAMKKALENYKAQAIAFDCINLFDAKIVDAWPCLGFAQLWLDGYIPVCEADPYSAIVLLIMWYLLGKPGFISDPVVDHLKNEVIYYHCYSPLNPFGGNKVYPYIITPAHLNLKRASIYVELPVNEDVTAVQVWPEQRMFIVHRGKAIGNEYSLYACSTKLVAKTNAKALEKNWRWTWHRVVFFGDILEDLKDLATLMGFNVYEEDKE